LSAVTRRHVVLLGGAAALGGALGGGAACAQSPGSEAGSVSPEAEARIAGILGKYGNRFDDEQKADIRRLVSAAQAGLDEMRAYPLDNAVEPATLFRIYRPPRRPSAIEPHRSEPGG
jgi:hypothetical protein